MMESMSPLNPEHDRALRSAISLRDYTSELLNREAVYGVEFDGVQEILEELYVYYPGAEHLLTAGRPTHVPDVKVDPGLHFVTRLAFEAAAMPKTIRLRDAVRILNNFNFLAVGLIRVLIGDRTA
jgi:hypothetical protein